MGQIIVGALKETRDGELRLSILEECRSVKDDVKDS